MIRSALIVKLAAIGDVVMALPMVTALRARAPDVRIAWMAGRTAAPLLGLFEGIDETIVVDDAAILAGGRGSKASAVLKTWTRLAGRAFDVVYVAHSDARYRLLVRTVRAREFRWLGNGELRPFVPGRYMGDDYVRLVTGIDDRRAPAFPPPRWRGALPDAIAARLDREAGTRPTVALAPGGARNVARDNPLRRWPLERYAALARALHARGFAVVITGDRTDGWVREAFAGIGVIDLVGETPLEALVPLFARASVVVTHDSGPLHLARVAGTRVVALFGPTHPSTFTSPDARVITLWPAADLACSPCYDGREFAHCDDNVCLQAIGVDDVLDRVDAALRAPA